MSRDINGEFANRMRAYLAYSGKKQREVCDETGIEQAVLSHYVCGDAKPKYDKLKAIVKASGISADWWLGLSNAKPLDGE